MVRQTLEACKELPVEERRAIRDDYGELVVHTKDLDQWRAGIAEVLGDPVKPQGKAPTPADNAISGDFGGVDKNQTLFRKDVDDRATIAMFWPWQDGAHVTVKVAQTGAPAAATAAGGRGVKRVLVGLAILVAAVVVVMAVAFGVMVRRHEGKLAEIRIENVDPATLADGTYEGYCEAFPVTARVRAQIADGRIVDVGVTDHSHGPGYGAERIAQRIIAKQSLNVDAVSGATSSSTVILKAAELALRKAPARPAPPAADSAGIASADSSGTR